MKILFYSLNFSPELTATGKYTGEMAAWFADRGHEVHVIAGLPHYPQWSLQPGYDSKKFVQETCDGIYIMRVPHFIPGKSNLGAGSRIRMELSFIFKSLKYWFGILAGKKKYDVLIVVCPPLFTSVYGVIYKLLRNVPWVIHVQDIQTDVAVSLGLIKNSLLKRCLFFVEKRILKNASLVSTISSSMFCRLAEKSGSDHNLVLTPNWADPDISVNSSDRDSFRHTAGLPLDKFLVMYSGNLGEKQGIEILIEVAARLQKNTNVQMVVVGDGVAKNGLVALAEASQLSNIVFLPVQPKAMLASMLHAADLHLVIQRHETSASVLPSKLSNIFASARPCVVTAGAGTELETIVTSNNAGLAVEPGNAEVLTAAINRLESDSDLAAQLAQNAWGYAKNSLDMNKILSQFEAKLAALHALND